MNRVEILPEMFRQLRSDPDAAIVWCAANVGFDMNAGMPVEIEDNSPTEIQVQRLPTGNTIEVPLAKPKAYVRHDVPLVRGFNALSVDVAEKYCGYSTPADYAKTECFGAVLSAWDASLIDGIAGRPGFWWIEDPFALDDHLFDQLLAMSLSAASLKLLHARTTDRKRADMIANRLAFLIAVPVTSSDRAGTTAANALEKAREKLNAVAAEVASLEGLVSDAG